MPTKKKTKGEVTHMEVERFHKVRSQMQQLSTDLEALSKKAPDGPVSKFKLSFVNEKLRDANEFLTPPFKPIDRFEQFEDATLPSNSDAVMVLGQYLACLEQWRSAHVHHVGSGFSSYWAWNISGETLKAQAPTGPSRGLDDD